MPEKLADYLFKTLDQLIVHPDHGISTRAIELSGEAGVINPKSTLIDLLEHQNETVRSLAETELLGEIKAYLHEDVPTHQLLAHHHEN